MALLLFLIFLFGYLLGSIPFAYLMGRLRGVDLRKQGSGNVGATNAVRVLGPKWGIPVFFCDFLKGTIAVVVAAQVAREYAPGAISAFGLLAAAGCILGHNFPVWLGFKGGKGIATSGGIMLGFFPLWIFVTGLVIWVGVFFATRYVSLASIIGAVSLPATTAIYYFMGGADILMLVASIAFAALAVWRHRDNIRRLIAGTENRFVPKSKRSS